MSTTFNTTTPTSPVSLAQILDADPDQAPARSISMRTRTRMELRKAVNTRSGAVLTVLALAWAPLVLGGWIAIVGDEGHDIGTILGVGATGVAVLLPIVTLLQVSGEWGQRSVLTTFSLDPARGKVLAAKVLAGQVLALAVILSCLGISLLIAALMDVDLDGDSLLRITLGILAGGMLYALMGSAFGVLALSTALGIGLLLVGPQLVMNLGRLTGATWEDIGPWVEISTRLGELTGGSVANWGHLLAACLLWIIVPLAAGFWRIRRADVA